MVLEVDEIPRIPRHRKPKNKPTDSPWRQQRLPARRPVLTIPVVFPAIIVLGLTIFSLGLFLYFAVNDSLEFPIDYTDCVTVDDIPAKKLALLNKKPQCVIDFELTVNYTGKIKFYYQLDGFYQNFRTYSTSRNDQQLDGDLTKTDGCKPLACVSTSNPNKKMECNQNEYDNNMSIPYVPCGTIANSMFNDSFTLYYNEPGSNPIKVPFSVDGVLSEIERKKKFKNPQDILDPTVCQNNLTKCGCDQYNNTAKPKNWEIPICMLGVYNSTEDNLDVGWGMKNIDFQVWMKTAALPDFRKPYRTLNSQYEPFNFDEDGGLPMGNYTLIVNYNYNVDGYGIKKTFVITRESWMGPRNFFLPVIYMATGVFILLAMSILFVISKVKARFSKEST